MLYTYTCTYMHMRMHIVRANCNGSCYVRAALDDHGAEISSPAVNAVQTAKQSLQVVVGSSL